MGHTHTHSQDKRQRGTMSWLTTPLRSVMYAFFCSLPSRANQRVLRQSTPTFPFSLFGRFFLACACVFLMSSPNW
ncbi:hypothetical protein F4775DRAFT_538376 [Biscogniauxia sp. FL1348]|nr:hypothetical protein F4775DRAFT_538376 [Biscogniauxia sp. FL1348]